MKKGWLKSLDKRQKALLAVGGSVLAAAIVAVPLGIVLGTKANEPKLPVTEMQAEERLSTSSGEILSSPPEREGYYSPTLKETNYTTDLLPNAPDVYATFLFLDRTGNNNLLIRYGVDVSAKRLSSYLIEKSVTDQYGQIQSLPVQTVLPTLPSGYGEWQQPKYEIGAQTASLAQIQALNAGGSFTETYVADKGQIWESDYAFVVKHTITAYQLSDNTYERQEWFVANTSSLPVIPATPSSVSPGRGAWVGSGFVDANGAAITSSQAQSYAVGAEFYYIWTAPVNAPNYTGLPAVITHKYTVVRRILSHTNETSAKNYVLVAVNSRQFPPQSDAGDSEVGFDPFVLLDFYNAKNQVMNVEQDLKGLQPGDKFTAVYTAKPSSGYGGNAYTLTITYTAVQQNA